MRSRARAGRARARGRARGGRGRARAARAGRARARGGRGEAGAAGAGEAGAGGGWTPFGAALAVTLALLGLLLALPVVEFEHTSGHLLHVVAFGIELCPAPLLAVPCLAAAAAVTLAGSCRSTTPPWTGRR